MSMRAIIFDNHKLFSESFSFSLQKIDFFYTIRVVYSEDLFFLTLKEFGNDEVYVFFDYYLKERIGLSLISEIKRIKKNTKIIFVTDSMSPVVLNSIIQYKPNGIISKYSNFSSVKNCLKNVQQKKRFLDSLINRFLFVSNNNTFFSARELEILKYFADGFAVIQVVNLLFLSPHTVVSHKRKMMAKTNCKSVTQLLSFAKEAELLERNKFPGNFIS